MYMPSDERRICVVGSGLSGAVLGRSLAEGGFNVLLVEERAHVAGNCHTGRDPQTGIMVHTYGPHIFHTESETVWRYVGQFATMVPYSHRVRATVANRVYALPINLHTINQFFGTALHPHEARAFINDRTRHFPDGAANFEEQALSVLGEELYEAFMLGYTRKQWGVPPRQLPASILKRLPVRFTYDDNYFNHMYQGMPRDGYTELVTRILDVPNIEVRLRCRFEELAEPFLHVFYTGPIDRFFRHQAGRLGYRTLDFEVFRAEGDWQGTAVMNYCDEGVPYTRITEHKYFAPWEIDRFDRTICFREFSRSCGPGEIPFYPVRLAGDQSVLTEYVRLARRTAGISFVGRLGTYRYLDMDVTIAEALQAAATARSTLLQGVPPPAFFVDPLA